MNPGTEIVPASAQSFGVGELQIMAKSVAQSRLFPGIENEQAAFTLMLLCQAEGLHPIQAIRRYHVIKGRPSMRADAMQAEFQRQGGVIRWDRSDSEECSARFIHPTHAPDPGVPITLTMKHARETGLTSNDLYKKYPDQMLRARVISQGVRMVLPGVVVGIYTPEEVETFDRAPATAPRPAEEAAPVAETPALAPSAREKVKLNGDRIGAHGQDVRPWLRLAEEEVGTAVAAVANKRKELNLEPAKGGAVNIFEVTGHMIKEAVRHQLIADPSPVGKDGKRGRLKDAKAVALLTSEYGRDPEMRDWMRRELKRYLKAKVVEAWQLAENEAHGDAPDDPEAESQEPDTPAEDEGQLEPAAIAGDDGWAPGRE